MFLFKDEKKIRGFFVCVVFFCFFFIKLNILCDVALPMNPYNYTAQIHHGLQMDLKNV